VRSPNRIDCKKLKGGPGNLTKEKLDELKVHLLPKSKEKKKRKNGPQKKERPSGKGSVGKEDPTTVSTRKAKIVCDIAKRCKKYKQEEKSSSEGHTRGHISGSGE